MKIIESASPCKTEEIMSDDFITDAGYICCAKNVAKKLSKCSLQTKELKQISLSYNHDKKS